MRKAFRLLWMLAGLILIFVLVYLPTLSKYRDLKSQEQQIEEKIAHLEKRIEELQEEHYLLEHDTEHLQKVIRDELGLVKPGEVVYKFMEEKTAPAMPHRPQSTSPVEEGKKPAETSSTPEPLVEPYMSR